MRSISIDVIVRAENQLLAVCVAGAIRADCSFLTGMIHRFLLNR